MAQWGHVVVDHMMNLADEAGQRQRWFWLGPWNEGPVDDIGLLLDHAAVLEFLARPDNGLSEQQAAALARLATLLSTLRDDLPGSMQPESLIDSRRWRAIRRQAKATLNLMSAAA